MVTPSQPSARFSIRPNVLLLVETALAFGREVLHGVNRYIVSHEPWSVHLDLRELMFAPPTWDAELECDGVICRSMNAEFADQLRQRGIPAVDLCDTHDGFGLPRVLSDHRAIGSLAAEHLRERGFEHFGFCGFTGHQWSRERREGFQARIVEHGGHCDVYESAWGTTPDHTWRRQQDEIAAWVAALPKPAGVFATNDMRGQHVLDACRLADVAVPEHVAVIGVDNDELICDLCDPPLSSIRPNAEQVGYAAAELLDRRMRGDSTSDDETVRVPPVGVATRQSTDVLAIADGDVAGAVRFIREHACRGISVHDLLKHVPLSRSMLERRFRKYLGRSPQQEIRHVQVKRVRQLLAETDLTLERIAELAGYDHPEYMSVVFKRETGQTPGGYRHAVRNHASPFRQ